MWKGKPKAFNIDISENTVEFITDTLWDCLSDRDIDINVDFKDVILQVNVSPNGDFEIVGVNGHPIDNTKRLVDV